jgi:hypothetical protein
MNFLSPAHRYQYPVLPDIFFRCFHIGFSLGILDAASSDYKSEAYSGRPQIKTDYNVEVAVKEMLKGQ